MMGGTLPTTYRGSLGFLALVLLTVLAAGCPLRAAAQANEALVAFDPPQMTVDPGTTFSVAITVADISELRSYEIDMSFDPAVVEVQTVEQGAFLQGTSPVTLGPEIDNEAGTVTFGALGMGSGPWPSGSGQLASLTLRAVADGVTALSLRDVGLYDAEAAAIPTAVEHGQVQVGDEAMPGGTPTGAPTRTPTREAAVTATATSAAAATETATSPPEATATKTPIGGVTSTPEGTATETPSDGPTASPAATVTGTTMSPTEPAETRTPTDGDAQPPTEEEARPESATSTAWPGHATSVEASPGAVDASERTRTGSEEALGNEPPQGFSPWLIVAVGALAVAGIALMAWGVLALGLGRRPVQEPVDGAEE